MEVTTTKVLDATTTVGLTTTTTTTAVAPSTTAKQAATSAKSITTTIFDTQITTDAFVAVTFTHSPVNAVMPQGTAIQFVKQ